MLRAVLIDDEKPSLSALTQALGAMEDVQIVGAFTKPSELLAEVLALQPDVAFVDIEMPGMDGLELAARLSELPLELEIVFVTAYKQYALEAFEVSALDYVLKPVQPASIARAVERLLKRKRAAARETPYAAAVRIEALGGLAVYAPGSDMPLRFPTQKTEELFAFLLANRASNVSKWTLCESLWFGNDPDKAEQNLHTTVFRLKKTLKESGLPIAVVSQRGSYRMETALPCDYIELEKLINRATEGGAGGAWPLDELRTAVALYRGALFQGRDYAWCEVERERLRRQYATAAKKLARLLAEDGEWTDAVDVLLRMLERLPYDEEAYTQLLRGYLEQKDTISFLQHYERMERQLREELDMKPGEALRMMYERTKSLYIE